MESRLFRKAALDRLSSPEELDQILRVSTAGTWAALVGIGLLCGAAAVWAVQGSIPTTSVGDGMIVPRTGVITVVARAAGVVRAIDVAVGERVRADQVVARIAQPALVERLQGMRGALAALERKRARDLALKSEEVDVRAAAITRQRVNVKRSIGELEEQTRLAGEQVPVMNELFTRGLVTKQQVLTAQQKFIELQGKVEDAHAEVKQLDAQEFELRSQVSALDSELAFQIAANEREIAALDNELALQETVVTPYDGYVVEIKVSAGGTVAADGPVLSIQPESDLLEALVYMSSLHAKNVRVGMEARVSPSTVKPEEHGFMRGKVTFVSDYPATIAALMRNFQNEQLVSAVTSRGAVTEIRVALEPDPTTPTGYRWSSPMGPRTVISAGTLATARIVTERRAPITLVVPMVRAALGLR